MKIYTYFALGIFAAVANPSHAATLIQTGSVNGFQNKVDAEFDFVDLFFFEANHELISDINQQAEKSSRPGEFDLFDPGLGTLTSVNVTFNGSFLNTTWWHGSLDCVTAAFLGDCSTAMFLNASAETGISFSNWSPYRPVETPRDSPVEIRGAIRTVNGKLASGVTSRTTPISGSADFTSAEDLLDFTGQGTFTITGTTHMLGSATLRCDSLPVGIGITYGITECNGNAFFNASSRINGLRVTYTYTPNTAPVANAGPDQSLEATSATGALVSLNAGESTDADNDPLTYSWSGPFGTKNGLAVDVTLPLGSTTVAVEVSDGTASSEDTVVVSVVDSTAPLVSAPAGITAIATSALTAVPIGTATAIDAVDGTLPATADNPGPYPLGDTSITWSATDGAGNIGTASQTITINYIDTDNDGIPDFDDPDIDGDGIPNELDPNDFAVNQAPIVEALSLQTNEDTALALTLAVTDTDGPAPLIVSINEQPQHGALTGTGVDLTYTPDAEFSGTDSFSYRATDGYLDSEIATVTITVLPVNDAPELTVSDSTVVVQYSDSPGVLVLSATDIDSASLDVTVSGLPDGLSAGPLSCSTSIDEVAHCEQTITGAVDAEPGVYTALISVADTEGAEAEQSIEFTVNAEDAVATYTGSSLLTSQPDGTYTLTLRANVFDISAVTDNTPADVEPGDIANAMVSFVDSGGTTLCVVPLIGELFTGDTASGSASCEYTGSLGNAETELIEVSILVEDYYTGSTEHEVAVVAITRPGNSRLSGGGNMMLEKSSGTYAADPESPVNFGFNGKASRKGKKFRYKGRVNIVIRAADGRTYKIKSTAVQTLGFNVDESAPEYGEFESRASLRDVTDELNPISLGGNMTLMLSITDNGEPGDADALAITLWDRDGSLAFSSNWDGSRTIKQTLDGGNLQVR